MIEVSEYKGLTLGPVTREVAQMAAGEKWLEDEVENRQQGFGKGYNGQANAIEGLLGLFERDHLENDFGVIGIYLEDAPASQTPHVYILILIHQHYHKRLQSMAIS